MSRSASLLQTISGTLEISPSRRRRAPVIGVCVCLFVVSHDQRDHLSLPLMWGLSDLKREHRHSWTSQQTYPSFSVITASSYQTERNKIIIKDICCGDLSFMITQASKKCFRPVPPGNNVIKDNMAAVKPAVTRPNDSLATDNQLCMWCWHERT